MIDWLAVALYCCGYCLSVLGIIALVLTKFHERNMSDLFADEAFQQWQGRMEQKLDTILCTLNTLVTEGQKIMADLSALTAQVAANTSVEQSAVTLIQGLAAQIAANATDPVAIAALVKQLNTSAVALGAAITANTPAAPTPTPAPATGGAGS